ncbi:hypothetical protein STEG23_019667 [Scotinomys teguina]
MAATMKKAAAEDVNVTFEDQQKINKFARNTSRITELKEEIEVKKKHLQNLEDACDDILLADDDCLMIPYQIGDVFISHSQEETQEMLEEAKISKTELESASINLEKGLERTTSKCKIWVSLGITAASHRKPRQLRDHNTSSYTVKYIILYSQEWKLSLLYRTRMVRTDDCDTQKSHYHAKNMGYATCDYWMPVRQDERNKSSLELKYV